MTRFLRGALGALPLLFTVSCGSDSPTQPTGPIAVRITVNPVTLVPGQSMQLAVTASPPAGVRVTSITVNISGAFVYADSDLTSGAGSMTMTRTLTLPPRSGQLTVTATAHGTGESVGTDQVSRSFGDAVPPRLTATATPSAPAAVQGGDTIKVRIQASDDVSVSYVLLRATGAITLTDSAGAWTLPIYGFERDIALVVPANAPLDGSVALTAETGDVGGNVIRKELGTYTIRDMSPPTISARIWGSRANGAFAPGDTAIITLTATDSRALRSYGFVLGSMGDSTAASGKTAERTARVVLSNAGTYALSVFATDSGGNRSQVSMAPISVMSRTRQPVASLAVGGGYDIAWDAKRTRIYVSQPDSGQIAVLAGDGSSRLPSVSIPRGRPSGIDVTNGGDSLAIALRGTTEVGFLNLNSGALVTKTVLNDPAMGHTPQNLRVTADNQVIFTMTFDGVGYGGTVTQFDLSCCRPSNSVPATEIVPLAASGNRQRVFALLDNANSPEQGYFYDAGTGYFSGLKAIVNGSGMDIATDFTGAHLLAAMTLLTGDFVPVRTFAVSGALTNPVALTNDGNYAYFATSTGFVKMRTMDGVEIERVTLGHTPTHFRMLPDGLTLVATSATTVDVIDLW